MIQGQTDRWTDQQTDRPTMLPIELLLQLKISHAAITDALIRIFLTICMFGVKIECSGKQNYEFKFNQLTVSYPTHQTLSHIKAQMQF